MVCKDPDIAKLAARVINAKSFNFYNLRFLFEQASQSKSEDFVVELLRYHRANVNAKNEDGETPLHWAAANGYLKITKILISAGADVNAKNKYGQTPLHLAVSRGRLKVAEILISAGADDVNAKSNSGWTPLHVAAYQWYSEIAKVLLVHGADVNAKDRNGKTHLDLASYETRKATKQYLKNQQKTAKMIQLNL